jgi:hypothetical protein
MASVDIPTREEIRQMIREELRGARNTYSQLDGERPAGAGRARYLRAWRTLRSAADAGATAEGRARIITHEAWTRFVASEAARHHAVVATPETSRANRVLAALGGARS